MYCWQREHRERSHSQFMTIEIRDICHSTVHAYNTRACSDQRLEYCPTMWQVLGSIPGEASFFSSLPFFYLSFFSSIFSSFFSSPFLSLPLSPLSLHVLFATSMLQHILVNFAMTSVSPLKILCVEFSRLG